MINEQEALTQEANTAIETATQNVEAFNLPALEKEYGKDTTLRALAEVSIQMQLEVLSETGEQFIGKERVDDGAIAGFMEDRGFETHASEIMEHIQHNAQMYLDGQKEPEYERSLRAVLAVHQSAAQRRIDQLQEAHGRTVFASSFFDEIRS